VLSRWEKFLEDVETFKKKVENKEEEYQVGKIDELFPFHVYFSNAPQVCILVKTFCCQFPFFLSKIRG